jgi:hypothetical protein
LGTPFYLEPAEKIEQETKPAPLPKSVATISFKDVTNQSGLSKRTCLAPRLSSGSYINLQDYMGSGIASGDLNQDGHIDLFFAGGGCNLTYLGKGDGTFVESGERLGIVDRAYDSRAAIMADFDHNGLLDLLVIHSASSSKIFMQKSPNHFVEEAASMGFSTLHTAHTATVFDYDLDGFLDVFVGHYGPHPATPGNPSIDGLNGTPSQLFRNLAGKGFKEVTEEAKLTTVGWNLASGAFDANNDGYPDLFLANDWGRDEIFINQKDGTFRNHSRKMAIDDRGSGMNVSFTDFNGDNFTDVFVTVIDMYSKHGRFVLPSPSDPVNMNKRILESGTYFTGNKLWLNQGGQEFASAERTHMDSGNMGWSWSGVFGDFDNDGDEDLYVVNGWIPETIAGSQVDRLFTNHQGRMHLSEPPSKEPNFGRAAVAIDFDKDGLLDLVTLEYNENPKAPSIHLLKNTTNPKGNWLRVELKSDQKKSAYGASIVVATSDGKRHKKIVTTSRNYLGQEDSVLTFGLANHKFAQSIAIQWPGDSNATEYKGPFPSGHKHIFKHPTTSPMNTGH